MGRDRAQHLDLLVAQRVRLERGRRLHADEADELEEVVLQDVARRAGLLVERAAVLDAHRLGHGDLDVVHVAAVPERLEEAVPEAEDHQVADGLLAQVMVDAVDLRLAEDLADLAVELLCRSEVVSERLLDDDPPPAAVVQFVVEADAPELGDDLRELRRLGREVEQAVAACAALLVKRVEMLGQAVERGGLVEVQLLVFDPLRERAPCRLVERQHAGVFLERAPDLIAEGVVVVRAPADRQDNELVGQEVRPPQLVEGRHDLPVGEVAGRPEQHEDRRIRHAFQAKALAQDVLELAGECLAPRCMREPQLAHRLRRVLRAGRRMDGLVRQLGRAPPPDHRVRHDRASAGLDCVTAEFVP